MTMWRGSYGEECCAAMRALNSSIGFDVRLAGADIEVSAAWAHALGRAGVMSQGEVEAVGEGLQLIAREFEQGCFEPLVTDEDVHTAVERRLFEIIGTTAWKLGTGRSRNDQVATDLRMHLMGESSRVRARLVSLMKACLDAAERHIGIVMPGYTHRQQAQPVLFSHWLMCFFWRLERDLERLDEALERMSVLPLGSGALAGTAYPVNRDELAWDLGFASACRNSMDAVSDRDFAADFLYFAAMLQVHLSSLAEDLTVWAGTEHRFVEFGSSVTTGSSLMPQKRNPDVLELLRGKTGRMTGHLVGILTVLKALPAGYNKDLQEDKEALFDALVTLMAVLPAAEQVIRTIRPDPARMKEAIDDSTLSTDLADYLVRKGVPFRKAHHMVSGLVVNATGEGMQLSEVPLERLTEECSEFGEDVKEVFDIRASIERRSSTGGTATSSVIAQIDAARRILNPLMQQVCPVSVSLEGRDSSVDAVDLRRRLTYHCDRDRGVEQSGSSSGS